MRTAPLPILFLLAGLLTALAASAAEEQDFQLQARPSICVSYDSEQPCEMAVRLYWQSKLAASVCLFQAGNEEPLRCWQDALRGELELAYADTRDVRYRLQDTVQQRWVAETDIVVINRDLRESRKHRRHVWSIL